MINQSKKRMFTAEFAAGHHKCCRCGMRISFNYLELYCFRPDISISHSYGQYWFNLIFRDTIYTSKCVKLL